jgi:hypothetical protein
MSYKIAGLIPLAFAAAVCLFGCGGGGSQSGGIVTNPNPVALPASGALAPATLNYHYVTTIVATSGTAPFSWSINGTAVTGAGISVGNSLTASSTGTNTLTITGTPTTTTAVTLTNVAITDSMNTNATQNYSITINATPYTVSGAVTLINLNSCPGVFTVPLYSVHIANSDSSFSQNVTTDSSGNYSFLNVPAGSYTITPSIAGPSSVFTPASQTVSFTSGNTTVGGITVALGYTMTGAVTYRGSSTGRIYLALQGGCGEANILGTSISAPGTYTIRGLAPGNYTLMGWMDTQGTGDPNFVDPYGQVSVTTNSLSNNNITLTDESPTVPTQGPGFWVAPMDLGVAIIYLGENNGYPIESEEAVTSYEVQWSTDSSFSSTSGSAIFPAIGMDSARLWLINNSTPGISGSFTDGTPYYFRACGILRGSQTPWYVYGGSSPFALTIGAPSGYNAVNGTITIPSGVTINGPLYAGFYSQQHGLYVTRIAVPVVGSNAFTVQVPTGNRYMYFGILDQNKDGMVDLGDLTDIGDNTSHLVNIPGSGNVGNLTLPSANSIAVVRTSYWNQVYLTGSSTGNMLTLQVNKGLKLPVAVTLTAGPHVVTPVDLSSYATNADTIQFEYQPSLATNPPAVGDSYSFLVTYSDGTQETLTAAVTGVLNSSQLATSMLPSGFETSDTQPPFSWTYPANAGNYSYSFALSNAQLSGPGTIWSIPPTTLGGLEFLTSDIPNGFSSSDIPSGALTWDVDPTNSLNRANPNLLSNGDIYNWYIETYDSNGNSAQQEVWFNP